MSEASKLNVLTLNVWGIPFTAHQNLRMRSIVAAINTSAFDVVALQEMWQPKDRDYLAGTLRGSFPYSVYFASGGLGSGLMIVSRYPIIETAFEQFRLRGRVDRIKHGDYLTGKGVGLARIETSSGVVDVYNAHPHAQYQPDEEDDFSAHRLSQHHQVVKFVEAHSTDNPAVIMGDFNMRPDQFHYRYVTGSLDLQDAYALCNPDDAGYTYSVDNPFTSSDVNQRLDYVFVRQGKNAALRVEGAQVTMTTIPYSGGRITYSDHYGVEAALTLLPGETISVESSADKAALMRQLKHDLHVGGYDARRRAFNHQSRMIGGVVGLLPLWLVGGLLGKWLRRRVALALIVYALYQWWLAREHVGQEVKSFKAFLDALE